MQQKFYKELLDALADGVYFVDLERSITYWSKSAERLTGYSSKEVVGKGCADNILRHVDGFGNQLCIKGCPLAATMDDGVMREMDVYMHHKHGHRVPVAVRATPIRDDKNEIIGAVEIFSNNIKHVDVITELEGLRQEILRDPLTGIGNRRFADVTIKNLVKSMDENDVPYGILFVDIDFFKKINDTWGHDVGDLVLKMVAQTLDKSMRSLDVACRWGGEEFVVIVPNVTLEGLAVIGERLRMLVESSWIKHENSLINVTASFGGTISKKSESPSSVISRADKQVYLSKESGRNCVRLG